MKTKHTNQYSFKIPLPPFTWWEPGAGAMLDQILCSCGWESHTYFDGREYAFDEFKRHVEKVHCDETTLAGTSSADMGRKDNHGQGEGPSSAA